MDADGNTLPMRADICDSDDRAAVDRFQATLVRLGANILGKTWAIGVDAFRFEMDGEVVTVFSDAWSVDIEGPDAIVDKVLRAFREHSGGDMSPT